MIFYGNLIEQRLGLSLSSLILIEFFRDQERFEEVFFLLSLLLDEIIRDNSRLDEQ